MNIFTISATCEQIEFLKNNDWKLSKVIEQIGDLQCSRHDDAFKFIACEILGQMLSNKVARILQARLEELCNGEILPENILKLSFQDLRNIGLSRSKSEYLLNFAEKTNSNYLNFTQLGSLSDEEIMQKLTSIRGIGNWTAKMYLLFSLRKEDILPFEDVAFLQAYKWLYNTSDIKRKSVEETCSCWHPFSSYGARYLYRALDIGLTKIEINSFLS